MRSARLARGEKERQEGERERGGDPEAPGRAGRSESFAGCRDTSPLPSSPSLAGRARGISAAQAGLSLALK